MSSPTKSARGGPRSLLNKSELCVYFLIGTCPEGENCTFAHSDSETRSVSLEQKAQKGLIPSASKYQTENCFFFMACGMCLYHTRCCFIHYADVGGSPVNVQDLLDTPAHAHLDGIHGKGCSLPRLKTELLATMHKAMLSTSSSRGFLVRSPGDYTLPKDSFERVLLMELAHVTSRLTGASPTSDIGNVLSGASLGKLAPAMHAPALRELSDANHILNDLQRPFISDFVDGLPCESLRVVGQRSLFGVSVAASAHLRTHALELLLHTGLVTAPPAAMCAEPDQAADAEAQKVALRNFAVSLRGRESAAALCRLVAACFLVSTADRMHTTPPLLVRPTATLPGSGVASSPAGVLTVRPGLAAVLSPALASAVRPLTSPGLMNADAESFVLSSAPADLSRTVLSKTAPSPALLLPSSGPSSFRPVLASRTGMIPPPSPQDVSPVAAARPLLVRRSRLPTMLYLSSGYGAATQQYLAHAAMLSLSAALEYGLGENAGFAVAAFAMLSRTTSTTVDRTKRIGISPDNRFLTVSKQSVHTQTALADVKARTMENLKRVKGTVTALATEGAKRVAVHKTLSQLVAPDTRLLPASAQKRGGGGGVGGRQGGGKRDAKRTTPAVEDDTPPAPSMHLAMSPGQYVDVTVHLAHLVDRIPVLKPEAVKHLLPQLIPRTAAAKLGGIAAKPASAAGGVDMARLRLLAAPVRSAITTTTTRSAAPAAAALPSGLAGFVADLGRTVQPWISMAEYLLQVAAGIRAALGFYDPCVSSEWPDSPGTAAAALRLHDALERLDYPVASLLWSVLQRMGDVLSQDPPLEQQLPSGPEGGEQEGGTALYDAAQTTLGCLVRVLCVDSNAPPGDALVTSAERAELAEKALPRVASVCTPLEVLDMMRTVTVISSSADMKRDDVPLRRSDFNRTADTTVQAAPLSPENPCAAAAGPVPLLESLSVEAVPFIANIVEAAPIAPGSVAAPGQVDSVFRVLQQHMDQKQQLASLHAEQWKEHQQRRPAIPLLPFLLDVPIDPLNHGGILSAVVALPSPREASVSPLPQLTPLLTPLSSPIWTARREAALTPLLLLPGSAAASAADFNSTASPQQLHYEHLTPARAQAASGIAMFDPPSPVLPVEGSDTIRSCDSSFDEAMWGRSSAMYDRGESLHATHNDDQWHSMPRVHLSNSSFNPTLAPPQTLRTLTSSARMSSLRHGTSSCASAVSDMSRLTLDDEFRALLPAEYAAAPPAAESAPSQADIGDVVFAKLDYKTPIPVPAVSMPPPGLPSTGLSHRHRTLHALSPGRSFQAPPPLSWTPAVRPVAYPLDSAGDPSGHDNSRFHSPPRVLRQSGSIEGLVPFMPAFSGSGGPQVRSWYTTGIVQPTWQPNVTYLTTSSGVPLVFPSAPVLYAPSGQTVAHQWF